MISTIANLKTKNSTGFDNVTASILNSTKESIAKHLAHIVNLPITYLKTATFISIHKNYEENIANYRPLNVLCKTIEKINLTKYLNLSISSTWSLTHNNNSVDKSTQLVACSLTEQIYY